MSLYQLTIEQNYRVYTRARRGEVLTAQDDIAADMYLATEEIMTAAGLPAYEVSNYARRGAECRHNLVYWQTMTGLALGRGPAAEHKGGRLGLAMRRSLAWLDAVAEHGHGLDIIHEDGRSDAVAGSDDGIAACYRDQPSGILAPVRTTGAISRSGCPVQTC